MPYFSNSLLGKIAQKSLELVTIGSVTIMVAGCIWIAKETIKEKKAKKELNNEKKQVSETN